MLKKILANLWEVLGGNKDGGAVDYDALLPMFPYEDLPIEKLIHQTYYSKSLPDEIVKNIDYLKRLNPQCSYTLWLDEDIEAFIRQEYGATILDYYHRINSKYGAARADFFRYLLIYRCGGLYIDIKSSLNKSFDEFVSPDLRYLLCHWDNQLGDKHEGAALEWPDLQAYLPRGEYVQWFVCAKSGHPYLRQVILDTLERIDNYNPFRQGVGAHAVFRTTGPIAYSYSILSVRKTTDIGVQVDEVYNRGLEYSIYERESSNPYAHKNLWKRKDYSQQLEPLIYPLRYKDLLIRVGYFVFYTQTVLLKQFRWVKKLFLGKAEH